MKNVIVSKKSITDIPLIRLNLGKHSFTNLAIGITGIMKIVFNSGYSIIGISGKTIYTPPFLSAIRASSKALPTSFTVKTLNIVSFSNSLIFVDSLSKSVLANHGQSAYALIPSSSQGFGAEQRA